MHGAERFSVTLPQDLAQMVKAKVASGEYSSESEVIGEGLRALLGRDRNLESWLGSEAASASDQLKADPSSGRTPEEVWAALSGETKTDTKLR